MDKVDATQGEQYSLEPGRASRQVCWCGVYLRQVVSEAWVYMLRCRDNSLYTGWTTDVERRLARHRAGKASRYTASRLPVELALALPMPDRSAARREEARIKRLDRAGKLALLDRAAQ
jgi:putative endonuclease